MLRSQLFPTCYTAFRIKNCLKNTSAIHAYLKKEMAPCASDISIIVWKVKYPLRFVVGYLQPVIAVWIKNCLKSTFAIRVATMKNTDDFRFEGKPSHAAPNQHFAVSKDEWDTKEDTGKSMKNALYVLWYAKMHLSAWSDVKQWKNQAHSLSHYKVRLVWRHQSVTYLLSR